MTEPENKQDRTESINALLLQMLVLSGIGVAAVALTRFSYQNLASFVLGSFISLLNLLWLKRLVSRIATAGKMPKYAGFEWTVKILFIFGSISLLILKAPINVLIFILGLSILPLAVIFNGVTAYIKLLSGGR